MSTSAFAPMARLAIALDPDVMLVSQMNGQDLPKPNESAWNAKRYGMIAIYAVPVTIS